MQADDPAENRCSRLYVCGLPDYLDEPRLKETFALKGSVTDVKIVRTKEGRSRQFGFVGFQDADQAEAALSYFNNSFLDTSRISIKTGLLEGDQREISGVVQFAERLNSASLGRPWSKHSKGSSAYSKHHKEDSPATEAPSRAKRRKVDKVQTEPAEEDPELQEFLRVMQPRSKSAVWANDTIERQSKAPAKNVNIQKTEKVLARPETADPENAQPPAKKGKKAKQSKADKAFGEINEEQVLQKKKRKKRPADEHSGEDTAVPDDPDKSDMEYLRSRVKAKAFRKATEDAPAARESLAEQEEVEEQAGIDNDDESIESETLDEADLATRKASNHAAGPSNAEVPDGESAAGRLFLRNLPYGATEADLAALLGEFGDLSEVHLVVDRSTMKSKGYALVQFAEAADAEAALSGLDGSIFQGRLLHILPAKPPKTVKASVKGPEGKEEQDAVLNGKSSSYKKQKAAQRVGDAGNRAAWNPLFMRADTVAEAIAMHYGVSKSELLNKDATDLPVRMALGETHVIALTKHSLAAAGVSVEAIEAAATSAGKSSEAGVGIERSDRALLVKNLPFTATQDELQELFSKSGKVLRLALPETKTLAVVEFSTAADARRAFKTVSYKRYHNVPLYLEWAPKHIFSGSVQQTPPEKAYDGEAPEAVDTATLRGEETDDVESSSLYVKNLAWSTSEAALLRHFDATFSVAGGTIRAATVARRKGDDGKSLSAGYGFVECSSESAAKAALRKLQGSMLDGHKLLLQLSIKKGGSAKRKTAKKKKLSAKEAAKQTKLVVRNVAFEAEAKELRALFQPFGQVKSVRLPRKFDNSHRGFAFVDFLTHQEACHAIESVAGTHLYGRRLVCEWAEPGEDTLDDLRAKTAARFQADDA